MSERRLLVVDDDVVAREIAVMALERSPGWHAASVGSGVEALAAVERDPPDAVLVDMWMPGMNGPEVVDALRSRPQTRDLPIIVLTASDRESEVERLRQLPVSGVVRKPFRPDSLAGAVRTLLGWEAM